MVYETENSMVEGELYRAKVWIFKNQYNLTLTPRCNDCYVTSETTERRSRPSFFPIFLLRVPLSTDVPVLLLDHSDNVSYGACHVYKPLFGSSVATCRLASFKSSFAINENKPERSSWFCTLIQHALSNNCRVRYFRNLL